MIDHISIPVRDLTAATAFYESVLAQLGYARLVQKPGTVGFGKKYPDFWLNLRPQRSPAQSNDGFHVCIRAGNREQVQAFFDKALELGAEADGAPGIRQQYSNSYFAAFITDADGNRVEAVTFIDP